MSYDMTMMMIVILVVRYARDMVVGYWLLRFVILQATPHAYRFTGLESYCA